MNFKCKPKKLIKNKVFVTITTDYNDGDYIKETTELPVSDFDQMFPEIKNMIKESKHDRSNYEYEEYPYQLWLKKAREADGDESKKYLFYLFDMQPRDRDNGEYGHSLEMVTAIYHDENGMQWDVIIY